MDKKPAKKAKKPFNSNAEGKEEQRAQKQDNSSRYVRVRRGGLFLYAKGR